MIENVINLRKRDNNYLCEVKYTNKNMYLPTSVNENAKEAHLRQLYKEITEGKWGTPQDFIFSETPDFIVKQKRKLFVKQRLEELDKKAVRAIRALTLNQDVETNMLYLSNIETETHTLREELKTL